MSTTYPTAGLKKRPLGAKRAILASSFGNLMESYDNLVYGYLAVYIGLNFFPTENPTTSLLATFATFAVGFIARPIGTLIFGHIGDRYGRKSALILSVVGMAVVTTVVGLLPTYETIGPAAAVLLVALRMCQGIAVAGEWAGSAALLIEYAPANRRGFYGSFNQVSTAGGFVLAAGVVALVSSLATEDQLAAWAWRIPFLIGAVTGRSVQTTMVKDDDVGEPVTTLDRNRIVTLIGLIVLAVMVVPPLNQDVGFTAICIAVIISFFSPKVSKGAVSKIAWPTVLLICGIVTYVELMERLGTIDWLGNLVAGMGAPLFAALLICLIGAVVSAFASTTGILGALIPLAVPFLLTGSVGEIGMIIALAISSSVVDSSPFSTSGALVVANSPEEQRDQVFKQLMRWGFSMVLIAPIVTWLIFVVPGWG